MFYIAHSNGVTLAAKPPENHFCSPAYSTDDMMKAQEFDTWAAASDASQNFGPEWYVEEIG